MKNLKPSKETELTAMRVVMEHERTQGRQVEDVSAKNLGYDVSSLDTRTGDLKLWFEQESGFLSFQKASK